MTVSTATLKARLQIEHDEFDDLLAEKIDAARGWIEGYIGEPVPAENAPAAIEEAIRQLAAHLFYVRGDGGDEGIPATVKALAAPFRTPSF